MGSFWCLILYKKSLHSNKSNSEKLKDDSSEEIKQSDSNELYDFNLKIPKQGKLIGSQSVIPKKIDETLKKINLINSSDTTSMKSVNEIKIRFESVESLSSETRSIGESITSIICYAWKLCVSTPFAIMIPLRAYIMFWILRYNSILSISLLAWNYYSISYDSTDSFYKITPWMLFSTMSLQIIGSKIASVNGLFTTKNIYLNALGFFDYDEGEKYRCMIEFNLTLIGFILVDITIRMIK